MKDRDMNDKQQMLELAVSSNEDLIKIMLQRNYRGTDWLYWVRKDLLEVCNSDYIFNV